jgi:hypothetical protein
MLAALATGKETTQTSAGNGECATASKDATESCRRMSEEEILTA